MARNWSPEQRAAAAERMRQMNADPAFRARKVEGCRTDAVRASRADKMRVLRAKMEADPALRDKWYRAVCRSRTTKAYRAAKAEEMRQRMVADPELRIRASENARRRNADPAARSRQVAGRRGFQVPVGFEQLYRALRRKVGATEARRLVREEAVRAAQKAAKRGRE